MSLQVCNIHVGNLLNCSLGPAFEPGQVMGSHNKFSVQCESNKGAMWYVRGTQA